MVAAMPKSLTESQKICAYAEKHTYKEQFYDLVLGVWSLCYLNDDAIKELLSKLLKAVRAYRSYLLLIEPVTGVDDPDERIHLWKGTELLVRDDSKYKKLIT